MHPPPAFLSPGLGPTARAVLDVVRRRGGASRAEIAEAVGVSVQAATQQTAALEAQGFLESSVQPERRRGPPAARYRIAASGAYGVGVQVARLRISAVVVDLAGRVLAEASEPVARPELEEAVAISKRLAEEAIASSAINRSRALGVGVAIPGSFDRRSGALVPPPTLADWARLDLATMREAFGESVVVENNANAAAIGETRFATPTAPGSVIYLYLDAGVGAGIMLDGRLRRGDHGFAGEIGRLPISPVVFSQTGFVARRLADIASGGGLARWLGEPEEAVLDETQARECEPEAFAAWVESAADALAPVLAAAIAILDVARVTLGGPASVRIGAALRDALAARLARGPVPTHPAPRIELCRFGARAARIGAASMPIARALGANAFAD